MKILSYTLYITLLKMLVSIPALHASQRESSCSSISVGTITSTSQQNTRQQQLQKNRTNIMNFTLSDLAHTKDEKKPTFHLGDLVVKLPCGHSFGHAYLEKSMEGRSEGQLPRCPGCHREFEMDQVSYTRVVEEQEP